MGILDQVAGVLRVLPGGDLPAQVVSQVGRIVLSAEQAALRAIADRLLASASQRPDSGRAALAPAPAPVAAPRPVATRGAPARTGVASETPAALLDDLLSRAMRGSTETGHVDYHLKLLRQLVPDEARIFATLATTEQPSPCVTVLRRGTNEPVLRHASLIGRTATVTVPSRTPAYLTHLLRLGIIELGPEDPSQGSGYELVLAERAVRDALRAGQLGKLPAKVVRGTVRISPTGRELWAAARPGAS